MGIKRIVLRTSRTENRRNCCEKEKTSETSRAEKKRSRKKGSPSVRGENVIQAQIEKNSIKVSVKK